ncbi:MAG: hypothetical protein K0Q76_3833 [Panacagrimonas sp.]|jgi:hypothetical protein|nr:hypothetical protein [Panacagrimonas sp.]
MRPALAACWLLPWLAVAAPPDYSHLSDEQLQQAVAEIAIGLIAFAALALYGWGRYRRGYVPAPGRFTPTQIIASVLAIIAVPGLGLAAYLR